MMQRIGMAIGAGLAAALLFAVTAKGTALAVLLGFLAPLPIMIATLGWGFDMGALAAAIASLTAAALIDPLAGGLFAGSTALPAWLLSMAATLPLGRFYRGAAGGDDQRLPVGAIVGLAALIGALLGIVDLASLILVSGTYEKGVEAGAAEIAPILTESLDGVMALPSGVSVNDLAAMIVRLWPATQAAAGCLMFCANLYAGARAVQLSQRLKRPWANLPEALALPPYLAIGLIVLAGLALVLRGAPGQLVWIGVGALGCAFVLQGLAVIHCLSRGLPARAPMLVLLYLVVWIAAPLSLPAIALLGLVESFLSLRARRAAGEIKPGKSIHKP